MKRIHWLAVFTVATLLCCVSVPATALGPPPGQDRDTTRPELANFDVFLDGHPEIAEQLKQDASLVNNEEFLESHPALQQYLVNHPRVREELQENPRAFMKGEARFDRGEAARPPAGGENDIRRGELTRFDNFLDSHPAIAQELATKPSLINNEEYVEKHPELQQFLKTHPEVQEELKENPRAFMNAEARFDKMEAARGDSDITRGELAAFDGFLDKHPAIAQQISKDPSLVNNEEYVENHPELQQFLKAHRAVREELKENPQAFMNAEGTFESHEHGRLPTKLKPKPAIINNPDKP